MLNIFITDLSAYNNGHLVGEWVSLPMSEDELSSKIKQILDNGSKVCGYGEIHEEYFITDFEFTCEYKIIEVEEYSNPYTLNEALLKVESFEEYDLKRVSFLMNNYLVSNLDEAIEKYEDAIIYEDMTLIEVVEQYIEESIDFSNIPDIIKHNIDYESIARDFETSGEYFEENGSIFQYFQ